MFPEWLDPALIENTAAAMLRGLNSLTANWGELIAAAQTIMGHYQEMPLDRVSTLYDEANARALTAAARVLDTASQSSTELPEDHRNNLKLLAAVAFGMCANFSSAKSVQARSQAQEGGASAQSKSASPRSHYPLAPHDDYLVWRAGKRSANKHGAVPVVHLRSGSCSDPLGVGAL